MANSQVPELRSVAAGPLRRFGQWLTGGSSWTAAAAQLYLSISPSGAFYFGRDWTYRGNRVQKR